MLRWAAPGWHETCASAPSRAPAQVGRLVANVFTAIAWQRAGEPAGGRWIRTLGVLGTMVRDARKTARALGDESDLIYSEPVHTRAQPAQPKPLAPLL